jgi:folate-dependent phosphoribosylglycinamide formyltransferase PurN
MNIALFTSNHLRHKYIANQLTEKLPVTLIICEEKSDKIENFSAYNDEDIQLLESHFIEREKTEKLFFGNNISFPTTVEVINLPFGQLNSEETVEVLEKNEINLVLLFGTSLIKPLILDHFPDRVINLHLGLSPYYKGSGTNFFPIVNEEFECIGATFHIATNQVDAGALLHQFRLNDLAENETIHSIGNKVILKAGQLYPKIVQEFISKKIKLHQQNPVADFHEYRIKDFTPTSLRKALNVLSNNGIGNYLKQQNERIKSKPILSNFDE